MKKILASFLILALFIYGVGFYGNEPHALFPSFRLLNDTEWDFSLLWNQGAEKTASLLFLLFVAIGFWGWAKCLQNFFFAALEKRKAQLLGFAISISLFSLFVLGLGINGLLYGPLVFLFFVPAFWGMWKDRRTFAFSWPRDLRDKGYWLLILPVLIWLFEYFSPPIIWDAILDHFRYAGELSRLHEIPFQWTNHTGDMPKASELILAGFWSFGGESLSKLSSILAVVGIGWLLYLFGQSEKKKTNFNTSIWIFLTCPFFLAIFSWGYVEGFLALYETLALYCLWNGLNQPRTRIWMLLTAYFCGFAFSIKYTAVLAIGALIFLWLYERFVKNSNLKLDWLIPVLVLVPVFPWLLKNWLAFCNPFYPLATSLFGISSGYGPGMESELLQDTGIPDGLGIFGHAELFWKVFFTSENGVGAVWTPLIFMSLPWAWKLIRNRFGLFVTVFCAVFWGGWFLFCTSLRHASGGAMALVIISVMAWMAAFEEKQTPVKYAFAMGTIFSLWFCISAQLTTTAPYASALGLEDPLLRLKRHYSYDTDTYQAYRFIEDHSDPRDKVVAFAVFQTYPLQRTSFVDFKWKRPIFLEWASGCKTAEQLAQRLHEEGVRFFLYQQWEAAAMSKVEKDFNLVGMPVQEYVRFWQLFMEPVEKGENSTVYEIRVLPRGTPRTLDQLPGLQETGYWKPTFHAMGG